MCSLSLSLFLSVVRVCTPWCTHRVVRRFCLIAHGDDATTHKLPETMAIAALGGCLPLIVHTSPHAYHLPYAADLDYCKVAFLVSGDIKAWSRMSHVLDRLDTVSAEEAASRQRVAAAWRGAFVVREGATFEAPIAAHYMLASMCAAAQRRRGADALARCSKAEEGTSPAVSRQEWEWARSPYGKTPRQCLPS